MLAISSVLRFVLVSFIHRSSSTSEFNANKIKVYQTQDEDIVSKNKNNAYEYFHKYNNDDNQEYFEYNNNDNQYNLETKQQHAGPELKLI